MYVSSTEYVVTGEHEPGVVAGKCFTMWSATSLPANAANVAFVFKNTLRGAFGELTWTVVSPAVSAAVGTVDAPEDGAMSGDAANEQKMTAATAQAHRTVLGLEVLLARLIASSISGLACFSSASRQEAYACAVRCARRNGRLDTYANDLLKRGTGIYTGNRPLGHAKLVTTERYLHLSDDDLADAIAKAFAELPGPQCRIGIPRIRHSVSAGEANSVGRISPRSRLLLC